MLTIKLHNKYLFCTINHNIAQRQDRKYKTKNQEKGGPSSSNNQGLKRSRLLKMVTNNFSAQVYKSRFCELVIKLRIN